MNSSAQSARLLCAFVVAALLSSCRSNSPTPPAASTASVTTRRETAADREHLEGQLTDAFRTLVPGYGNQPITYTTPTGKRTFTPKN